MRKASLISMMVLVASCGQAPKRGVDTTLPDDPVVPATISGNLTYPSDYIPENLQVCAEAVESKKTLCDAEKSGSSYSLKVPPGSYRVFARAPDMAKIKAYYSEFVTCGYEQWCASHTPIVVTVAEGETRSDVHPGDWYAAAGTGSDREEPVAQTSYPDSPDAEAGPDPEQEDASEDHSASGDTDLSAEPRGSVVGLFSTDDYPQAALRNDEQGTVGIAVSIGPTGRVESCGVTSSSGSPSLDETTCRIVRARGRFTPARDVAGDPTSATMTSRIRWQLPSD